MIRLLASALLTSLLVLPAADAALPVSDRAQPASVVTTYDCTSDFGYGSGAVRVSTKFPSSVQSSEKLASRAVRVRLTVPEEIVDELRRNHVDSLEGSSSSTRLSVGAKRVRVRNVRLPLTELPDSGAMPLRGKGRISGFTLRRAGKYAVRVPKRFTADLTAWIDDASATRTLTCAAAAGAPRRLTTLLVKD